LLTKSIITSILLASLGGGTYYYGEESIRTFLEDRLKISRVQKQIIPVKPKRVRSGNTVKAVDSSSVLDYTFFKTLTSSNANNFPGLIKTNTPKITTTRVPSSKNIVPKKSNHKTIVVQKTPIIQSNKPLESLQVEPTLDYMVQVSSFRDMSRAEIMKNRLISNGYPAFLLRVDIPDKGVWYRVYLGKFTKREEAVLAAESAKTKNQLTAVVHQVS